MFWAEGKGSVNGKSFLLLLSLLSQTHASITRKLTGYTLTPISIDIPSVVEAKRHQAGQAGY